MFKTKQEETLMRDRGSDAEAMRAIKDRLADITRYVPQDRPVVYLDYPMYLNVGDLLIMQGTEKFFADYGYNVVMRASGVNYSPAMGRRIPRDATIVLQGGGNFGDLYPDHQHMRESIIANFPDHKIVVFPMNVQFMSEAERQRSAAIFRQHPDLTLLVRDEASLEDLYGAFSRRVVLMPDMAHQLWDDHYVPPDALRDTLYLIRRDIEAVPGQSGRDSSFDWDDLISDARKHSYRMICKGMRLEGMTAQQFGMGRAWYRFCDGLVGEMRNVFEAHREVVTSRMHGCIFAALLKKPVRFADNSYGKLGRYYDLWLRDVKSVTPAH
ncbi:polysaccharide pyruvyl transferase family protein [Uliginosibacterium sp. sgz301328]|uniref:polysaccharide pyruvyl transferase family protein n=1 Tax=Uliginosibacterium sp. sgz301328 TaxID=3243764 RepID=UPI00359DDDCF